MADHFRRLAIDKDKAGEMILVVNKMDRAAKGNTKEQQDIIREGLRDVLAPYTPEQLHLSFIDAQSYLDSVEKREGDPELADEFQQRSGYNEFIETLNPGFNATCFTLTAMFLRNRFGILPLLTAKVIRSEVGFVFKIITKLFEHV